MKTHTSTTIAPHWLLLIAVAFCCAFSGCASGTLARDAKAAGTLVPHDGKGRVAVYRTSGFAGAGTKLYLFANEQLVGPMGRGAFYSYDAAPGPVALSFSYRPEKRTAGEWVATGLGSGAAGLVVGAIMQPGEVRKRGNVTVNLRANETQYVRIDGFDLTPMSPNEGQAEMDDCHWLNEPAR